MAAFSSQLEALLTGHLYEESAPGPGSFRSIDLGGICVLAQEWNISQVQAMVDCLEHDIWPQRFCRNRGVFSPQEQSTLLSSHVAVIGCGGLGGCVISLLARLGLGALTVFDPDVFTESNLNRQWLCREDRLGRNKAVAAQEELALVASHVQVQVIPQGAQESNLARILPQCHCVVDCLDNLEDRRLLARAARHAGIPFVHGAIAGEEGFALLELPQGEPRLEQLYPATAEQTDMAEQRLGVPTLTPAATAILQCSLVINVLLGREVDSSCLLHLDLSIPEIERLGF